MAVKRTIEDLTNYKVLLDYLLAAIRSGEPSAVDKIVHLIRQDASLEDIAQAVGCGVRKFRDPEVLSVASQSISEDKDNDRDLESPTFIGAQPRRGSDIQSSSSWSDLEPAESVSWGARNPYARVSLETLCDVPLFNVPAKPWTSVTDDDDLVSHLVSLYFTWDHPCAQFVEQGTFLEHMKQGQLDSEFCSPFLVNSILSVASVRSRILRRIKEWYRNS